MISILHDGDESGTLRAETGFVHTNSARRRQWKHSGRLQTLDLTKTPFWHFGIFWIFFFNTKCKNVGFTGGKSWGLVDGVVGNQVHGGGKLPGALLGPQEAPGGPKQGFWGGPRGLGPPRAPLQVAPIFPVWETRILTYLGPIGPCC